MSLNLDRWAWRHVRFDEVVKNLNVTIKDPVAAGVDRVIAMEHLDPGELKIKRWGSLEDGTTFTRRVKPGQTLFGKRRAYQRKAAYAEFDAITSGDILVFEAEDTLLLPQFLPFIVQSDGFYEHALGTSAGSLSPRTNWRDLSNFEFDLPPLNEQKRLADLFWALERHRLAQSDLLVQLSVTASTLVSDLRRRTATTKQVREVATVRNGQSFPKRFQGRETGDLPFFKVADLDGPGNERYYKNALNWVDNEMVTELKAEVLPAGTVVTARVGAAIRLERRRALALPALVDDNHLVIRPHSIDPGYLLAVLSETALAQIGNDGVVPSLNQQIVGSVSVPALSAEDEKHVGAAYRQVHDARDLIQAQLAATTCLRGSLLTSVFGGA